MVVAADGVLQGAAAPDEAVLAVLVDAAAGGAGGAGVVVVADAGRRGLGGRRRRRGLGGICALLQGVRGLHRDPALAGGGAGEIPLHPHVPGLSPAFAPGVPHNPEVLAVLRAVAHRHDAMVEVCSARPVEDALQLRQQRLSAGLDLDSKRPAENNKREAQWTNKEKKQQEQEGIEISLEFIR